MALKFNNPEVDAKYATDYETDPLVHLPGGKEKNGWMGRLSDIPLVQADRWIGRKNQNLLKIKEEKKAEKKAVVKES